MKKLYGIEGINYITCKICNKRLKSLNRHPQFKHGISLDDYRDMFSIPYYKSIICEDLYHKFSKRIKDRVLEGEMLPFKKGHPGKGPERQRLSQAKIDSNRLKALARKRMDEAVFKEIINNFDGANLNSLLKEHGFKNVSTFYRFKNLNHHLNNLYNKKILSLPFNVQIKFGCISDDLIQLIKLKRSNGVTKKAIANQINTRENSIIDLCKKYHIG